MTSADGPRRHMGRPPSSGRRSKRAGGLTLIETALLVSLVGVVLAVMVPAFARRVRVSKVAEAVEQLEAMHHAVAGYYATPQPTAAGKRLGCLPEPAGPAPREPSPEPEQIDFWAADTPGSTTWRAIGFRPEPAIRYRYTLVPARVGCGGPQEGDATTPMATLRAEGDLDADGEYSRIERVEVRRDGQLVPGRRTVVVDRVE